MARPEAAVQQSTESQKYLLEERYTILSSTERISSFFLSGLAIFDGSNRTMMNTCQTLCAISSPTRFFIDQCNVGSRALRGTKRACDAIVGSIKRSAVQCIFAKQRIDHL